MYNRVIQLNMCHKLLKNMSVKLCRKKVYNIKIDVSQTRIYDFRKTSNFRKTRLFFHFGSYFSDQIVDNYRTKFRDNDFFFNTSLKPI